MDEFDFEELAEEDDAQEQATAEFLGKRRPGADRKAKNPGGMECCKCGCIFIGEDWHDYCAHCCA